MKNNGKILLLLGSIMIAAALLLTAYNINESLYAAQSVIEVEEILEDLIPTEPSNEQFAIPDYILNPMMEMPIETIKGRHYIGIIRIPSLELELPVIDQWDYDNLKYAPCRYTGSVYQNNLILCAHNYMSHFGNLGLLNVGDIVSFEDIDGNTFQYEVVVLEVLQRTQVEEMVSGDWDLTLFTCTLGGQSRITVRCMSIDK